MQAFLKQLQPYLGEGYLAPVPVDCVLGEFRLTGEIRRLTARGSLNYRCAGIKAKDLLRWWVQHLVLNTVLVSKADCGGGDGSPLRTINHQLLNPSTPRSAVLVGREQVLGAPPLDNAREFLAAMLNLYWKGLTRPLKFFPNRLGLCRGGAETGVR